MSASTTTPPSNTRPNRPNRPTRLRRALTWTAAVLLTILLAAGGYVAWQSSATEADIQDHRDRVVALASENPATIDWSAVSDLPDPVQRWVTFTFPDGEVPAPSSVAVEASGDFRRPLTETFSPTTVQQITTTAVPALVFSARTSMPMGTWARAYDAYAEGEMEMKAKILSTLTVVDEEITPALNQTSLQRWLLESPTYPTALLPGGAVAWEAIDDTHARAVVDYAGSSAALVATFAPDGSLTSFEAETDGDLTTSYHGSGEYVTRGDYREVDGVMVPFAFEISRMADGVTYPFWRATITSYTVNPSR